MTPAPGSLPVTRALLVALVVLCALMPAHQAGAQPASPVVDHATMGATSTAILEFPGGIRIESDLSIEEPGKDTWLELVYRIGANPTWRLATLPPSLAPVKGALAATGWLDLQAQFIPPGLPITYQWRLAGTDGVIAVSPEESTQWYDDRWDWGHASSDHISMHWYGLDDAFAADILDSAETTVADLEFRFGMTPQTPYELWVYPDKGAFSEALVPNSREALAAATYPDFSITLAVVPDGFDAEIGRVVPHEIAHLVLFDVTDTAFATVPLWFNEGLATQIQTGGTDGYLDMVARAYDQDRLYSLRSIDVTFPYTAYEATLAYAASWSALEYIELTWGDDGIRNLVSAFATGVPWDDAILEGLGITMDELEQGWRAWIASEAVDVAA